MIESRRGHPRTRGHRYAGPLSARREGRHYGTEALAIGAIVATVAATAVSAYGAYTASEAQAETASYNKKVAQNQAQAAKDAAAIAEEQQREDYRRHAASQRALLGASNVSNEGSPLSVMLDSAQQAELDSLRIRYGGASQAVGHQADAQLQAYYGSNARRQGGIGVGTTLLTGAARSYGAYSSYAGAGATGGSPGADSGFASYRAGERRY
jgi:hypothetical protein